MPRQIQGSQRDFSFGEVDVDLKRNDEHPARKGGMRQLMNARIHNSGSFQNRPGRRALYPASNTGIRTERFSLSPGNVFDIQFSHGFLNILDSTGTSVFSRAVQGNGAQLPWQTPADIKTITYAIMNLSIYICFGHAMRPQVISWDGVATWSMVDYQELLIANQKRTPFYRISAQGVTMTPSALFGSVNLTSSVPYFTNAMIGARLRLNGRQCLITAITSSLIAVVTVEEHFLDSIQITFGVDITQIYRPGDVVLGQVSGAEAYVVAISPPSAINVTYTNNSGFTSTERIVGPAGSAITTGNAGIANQALPLWDEEVMNAFQGFPSACFTDQFRLGFCNFPGVPGGILWSAINSPTDLFTGVNPDDSIFEIAPGKVVVQYVVPGPESSEFVFCDRRVYYIPISPTNPLKPGSVSFQLLSGDGSAQVQPRIAQEAILYVNAGQNSMMAIVATGAYQRPFTTKNLTDFHAHLFNAIQCIATPSADGTFNERYVYVLNGDGSIAVGKYNPDSLQTNLPVIGWAPWSGTGVVTWIAAYAADVLFTSSYFLSPVVEILDDAQYLDSALPVNAAPAAFAPPGGKGPLWFIPSQTVTLMDQVTRNMGTYQIDANGFIVPQFAGGEDLTRASLVAGQQWTMTAEPFTPTAPSGTDVHQRINMRQIPQLVIHFINSTGFLLGMLFSSKQSRTTPALGTVMNQRRIPAYNTDEDATLPPILRESVETYRPVGTTYEPRVAIIKDTPGPLLIAEIAMEIST